jgi:hypothetical protein
MANPEVARRAIPRTPMIIFFIFYLLLFFIPGFSSLLIIVMSNLCANVFEMKIIRGTP